ncbi:hypothetical protein J6590_087960 [Homalodisca vitripennis]|nr:hypothetical protein J6590_087960 [Homalodisca vitripennis]
MIEQRCKYKDALNLMTPLRNLVERFPCRRVNQQRLTKTSLTQPWCVTALITATPTITTQSRSGYTTYRAPTDCDCRLVTAQQS